MPEIEKNAFSIEDINVNPIAPEAGLAFDNDDVEGQFIADRESSYLTPAQQARQRAARQQPKQQEVAPEAEDTGVLDTAVSFAKDVAGGIIEAPRQAVAGFLDATAEAAEVLEGVFGQLPTAGEDYEPLKIEAQPRTVTGQGVRSISQFMTGFLPGLKAAKGIGVAGKITKPMLAGVAADATVFDAHEERLSDVVQSVPALQNPLTEYLASDEGDTEAEGRFKNAVEGLLLGGAVDGFVKTVKMYKAGKKARIASEAEGKTLPESLEGGAEVSVKEEQEFIPFSESVAENAVEIKVPSFKTGAEEADAEDAANINLGRIESPEDIDALIKKVSDADAPDINEARRQKISNEDVELLADDLGMTVSDLLERRSGEAFNAEQVLASRKILVASGENLIKLAKAAASGGDSDAALFRRAMAQHQAIQRQVSGMTAEAGRALQSFNIIAKSSREQEKAIQEALNASGGLEVSRTMAKMLSELDDPAKIGKFVRDANKATTIDMLYEVWINGLLSSPATHVVNALSNTMTASLAVIERKVASAIGSSIPRGEADAQLKGMVEGAKDGFRLAWQALKTGEPTDVLEKVENVQRKSISSENLAVAGTAGRLVNFLGEVVRVPGRLLTSSDAFFKAVGYRMELHALAYRKAFAQGLQGDALAKKVNEIINNPPANIRMAAVDASRYQTFTNELGTIGKKVEGLRADVPGARVIMPFVRTPTNIMKYTLERTPLAILSKSFRDEVAAGGARKDLALGKLATGSMVMAVSADLAMGGSITGAGPTQANMRNIKRATGWQPYSIKVGDTYYAYNRLDPVGGLLGLAADMAEIMGQTEEADASRLAMAAGLSVAQNMASKTYMSGVVEFMDVFFSASPDAEAKNYKLTRYINRMAASTIPSAVAAVERQVSPELEAAYTMLDGIKRRIPGYSSDLPPRRNIFGEPIVIEGGIGPDILSPIYTSTDKKDKVADEIVAQRTALSMPRRTQKGVELSAQQYDRMLVLASGEGLKGVNKTLKKALADLFSSSDYKGATDGPDGLKSIMIAAHFTAYKRAALIQLIEEDGDLEAAMTDVAREKERAKTGR